MKMVDRTRRNTNSWNQNLNQKRGIKRECEYVKVSTMRGKTEMINDEK